MNAASRIKPARRNLRPASGLAACGRPASGRALAAVLVGVLVTMVAPARAVQSTGTTPSDSAGRSTASTPTKAAAPTVIVSIAPLRGLVEPMLIDAGLGTPGCVKTLIPPGTSEHGYEIPPSTLAQLGRADLVVLVGLGLEPQAEKYLASRPRTGRTVIVAGDVLGMKVDGEHEHVHEDRDGDGACDHDHSSGADPHVWLDPIKAEKLVTAVAESLITHAGQDAATVQRIQSAQAAMLVRIRDVDEAYRSTVAKASSKTLVVGHDAWGHLASRYGLTTVAIKGLMATEPTPASLENATKAIREQGAKAVFVEPQLSQKAGRRIAASTGVSVLVIDPLGDGDWVKMMMGNLAEFAKAMGVDASGVAPAVVPAAKP